MGFFPKRGEPFYRSLCRTPMRSSPATPLRSLWRADREYLLLDWINELLFLFESKKFLASQFDATVCDDGVRGTVHGEPYDSARHALAHEVKAVTYHGLKVEPTEGGWLAEVILDI